jgi:hypothetical protein
LGISNFRNEMEERAHLTRRSGARRGPKRRKIPDFLPCSFTASLHVWVYRLPKSKTEVKQVEELSVKSKIIKSVYFSQEDGRLRICFKNGEERLFEGVPSSEAHAMTVAPSPGHYYLDRIRTRFRRLAA